MKKTSYSELVDKTRRVYREPKLKADEWPELQPKKIVRMLTPTAPSENRMWKLIEISSWSGVGVVGGIAAIAMFTVSSPAEDEVSDSPWLDMPQFEELSL